MKKIRVRSATVADHVVRTIIKKGEMTLAAAAAELGCAPERVADALQELVAATKDPFQYIISVGESWTGASRAPLRTVQVFVEPRRQAALRRKMMRLPEFRQVARLSPPPAAFTLGQAARALKTTKPRTRALLNRYRRMGYLTWFETKPAKGRETLMWQRKW